METPSSPRRVTRSQTLAASNVTNDNSVTRMIKDSEKGVSKSSRTTSQQDRSALIDITNDSPIIGLAAGKLETPSSSVVKQRGSRVKNTPGSGEALLRGQVKTLLQRVEEEVDPSMISMESRPFLHLMNFIKSPTGLAAPTPANTPQVFDLSEDPSVEQSSDLIGSGNPTPIIEEQMIAKVVSDIFDGKYQDRLESEKCQLTRSLLLDFSEKSEIPYPATCSSSSLSAQEETECKKKLSENDHGSVWSVQVNASTSKEENDGIDEEVDSDDEGYSVDELCAGMGKMNVNGNTMFPKFVGKHTRFLYDSDDEFVEEQQSGQ